MRQGLRPEWGIRVLGSPRTPATPRSPSQPGGEPGADDRIKRSERHALRGPPSVFVRSSHRALDHVAAFVSARDRLAYRLVNASGRRSRFVVGTRDFLLSEVGRTRPARKRIVSLSAYARLLRLEAVAGVWEVCCPSPVSHRRPFKRSPGGSLGGSRPPPARGPRKVTDLKEHESSRDDLVASDVLGAVHVQVRTGRRSSAAPRSSGSVASPSGTTASARPSTRPWRTATRRSSPGT